MKVINKLILDDEAQPMEQHQEDRVREMLPGSSKINMQEGIQSAD